MIEDLTITYITPNSDITTQLRCPLNNNNAPYNIAELAIHLVKASSANPDVVITQFINEFNPDNIRVGRKDTP